MSLTPIPSSHKPFNRSAYFHLPLALGLLATVYIHPALAASETAPTTTQTTQSSDLNSSDSLDNQQFQACLDELAQSDAFASVQTTFNQYRPMTADPSVIKALNYQPEFRKQPWDYLASLVDLERVNDGIAASERYADILQGIEEQYGVNRYDVLGVWGVESDFGTKLGQKDVINSLATLSCFDRRQSYFRGEYASALKILQNGDINAEDFKGSWAGAFGQTQFMPATFLELAQDFDGDGRKDLVNSQADALASTANFLKKRGYQANQPWGYEVRLPADLEASSDRKNKQPMSHWRSLGITLPDGRPLPDDLAQAGLLLPAGAEGPAFLVGRNFDAFYAYNASENYALAIGHLSQLIAQKSNQVSFATPWPTDDPGLSRKQSREVQQALHDLGYDIGEVDGFIGDGTRKAIQQYQTDNNLEADGKAGQKIYQHLMQAVEKLPNRQSPAAISDDASQMSAPTQTASGASDGQNIDGSSPENEDSSASSSRLLPSKGVMAIIISLLILLSIILVNKFKRPKP
ncbi:lytic murein transglycosylase [Psychrobacter lutiphocae]|uniref:lytic murein transglycosylase n=1 Tax=Psychrobacter lutiphocae TaxID=540500 RepID=UPI00036754C4|nr:lytic murein transglycosylase [Psychrobacter lutiphocae]